MSALPHPPPSPGVGARRKGPKKLPRLPLSAFSPPNSGTSEKFPLPPSPSTLQPQQILDGRVVLGDGVPSVSQWKQGFGKTLEEKMIGLVLYLQPESIQVLPSPSMTNLAVSISIPFSLGHVNHELPQWIGDLKIPYSFHTALTSLTSGSVDSLKWAIQYGRPVDIDIQVLMSDSLWEAFENLLVQSISDNGVKNPPIVISNWLPPPHDMDLPIVKLMNHPSYREFQARTAALSLFPDVFIHYLPPVWEEPVPSMSDGPEGPNTQRSREWKRRIKMFLGPVMEAFGLERIIFGSSPSGSVPPVNAADWYKIARESLAELAVEQEAIDAVFCRTAQRVYAA